jgi:hypothetical protein
MAENIPDVTGTNESVNSGLNESNPLMKKFAGITDILRDTCCKKTGMLLAAAMTVANPVHGEVNPDVLSGEFLHLARLDSSALTLEFTGTIRQ